MNIFAKSNAEGGKIVLVTIYDREKDGFGHKEPRAGTFDPSNTVECDFSTNGLIDIELRIQEDPLYTVNSGELLKDGIVQNINPDGPELEYFRPAQEYVNKVNADMGTVTLNEMKTMMAWLVIVNANARDF